MAQTLMSWLKAIFLFFKFNFEKLMSIFRSITNNNQQAAREADTTSTSTSTSTSTEFDEDSEETSEETSTETSKENSQSESKNIEKEDESCFERFARIMSIILAVLTFPLSLLLCCKIIYEYERAVIFRFGKLRKGGARGPGLIFVLICIDECLVVDLRTETDYVYPQQVLTNDSVGIEVEAVIFFRLRDAILGVIAVGNYKNATLLLAQTTLRNIIGEKTLQEFLSNKQETVRIMQDILVQGTGPWGVVVERVEIKDIRLPVELQRSMAAEAEANRVARAKLISATGEKIAANALKYASDTLSNSPGALQMRYLQTMRTCSISNDNIYVIALYKEMLQVCRNFMSNLQDPQGVSSV